MNRVGIKPPFNPVTEAAQPCCTAVASSPQASGSRRRRLWELDSHAHCPLIGVCLPMAALRRVADKALGGRAMADDYELHCGVVADCQRRCALAEAVQRELDRRFLLPLRRAAECKTTDALAAWWQAQASTKDLPGALWATLTHPRCSAALEHAALGQVHMLQHQVGMATRVALQRFEALIDENAVLTRELAGAQRRAAQQAALHALHTDTLQADTVRLRGQLMARDGTIVQLRDELAALHAQAPELAGRIALGRENAALGERVGELRRALQAARAEVERLTERLNTRAAAAPLPLAPPAAPVVQLGNRAVLCVGGRTASVPVYRRLVEDRGGRFLHHDGGEEDNVNALDATLAAADLVICQAGCISHNAYWRVKDHCKRTGKRCVFVETPSASGLQRVLSTLDSDG